MRQLRIRSRRIWIMWSFLLAWGAPVALAVDQDPTRAKDLAILLPPLGEDHVPMDSKLFPEPWWEAIYTSFAKTSIGAALQQENRISDWRLVAVRFAPCQPLLPYLSTLNQELCQPELRLVWQPIQAVFRGDRWRWYADDRAIHALYRLDPQLLMSPEEVRRLKELGARPESLNPAERALFAQTQRDWAQKLAAELRSLRVGGEASAYDELGERPEFAQSGRRVAFLKKLKLYLEKQARPELLTQLTAFSLPEGRDPPLLDEWVFIAFEPTPGGRSLQAQPLTVRSRRDGTLLASYGESAQVSVRSEEDRLREIWDAAAPQAKAELGEAVIWTPRERQSKAELIADPVRMHVAHTSCASCHKLGNPPFDFHNLSYFEDREMSISLRVQRDVEHELAWLRR